MHNKNLFRGVALFMAVASMLIFSSCNGKKTNADAGKIVIKTDLSQLKVGDFYYNDGTFSTGQDSTKTCIGIVFSLKTSSAEQSAGWTHGQIVALANANASEDCEWGIHGKELSSPFGKYSWKNWKAASEVVNGYACTHASAVSGA